jgi:hypothetical protein
MHTNWYSLVLEAASLAVDAGTDVSAEHGPVVAGSVNLEQLRLAVRKAAIPAKRAPPCTGPMSAHLRLRITLPG